MVATKPWATREKRDRADSHTRALLVTAAQEIFSAEGYARTTVAHITAAAGVSRATFYVYFADKDEAFAVVAERVRERMAAGQDLTGLDPDDVRAVAEATNAGYLDAYVANLSFITVLEHQSLSDPAMAAVWEALHDLPRRRAARYVERLVELGIAHPAAKPDAIARAGGGMVAHFAPLVAHDPARRDDVVADLTAMFLRLLGADPEQ